MNKKIIKVLLPLFILSTLSIVYSTSTKEKVNTNVSTSIYTSSTDASEDYQGKLADMPEEYMTNSIKEYVAKNPETVDTAEIKIMNKDALKSYTYQNAPEDLRAEYEQNCKSVGKTPCDDDPIIVQNK